VNTIHVACKSLFLSSVLLFLHAKSQAEDIGSPASNQTERPLAEPKDPEAQFLLAKRYAIGDGVRNDPAEAAKWYRKAADQGHAGAQYLLGVCYDRGKGVPENRAEAFYWYRKSANRGYSMAQVTLGCGYELGIGVPKDKVAAYMWFDLAVKSGDASAKDYREELARSMTIDQIAKGQQLSREWQTAKARKRK
jgi:TPR repeat protein